MEYFESISSLKPIHVYLSFRGDDDTRKFIHRLSAALKAEGFRIFGDDKKRETIDNSIIPPYLLEAITESWICIVVFSKTYASSRWCLDELSKIAGRIIGTDLECANFDLPTCHFIDLFAAGGDVRFEADADKVKKWRIAMKEGAYVRGWVVPDRIIPVFYDVDHSFAEHILERYTRDSEKKFMRKAMKEVVSLSGCVRNDSIEGIVREVKKKRDRIFYGSFSFVGMQSRVEEVEKLLDLSSDDAIRVVGICGMSGLGKSSIAKVLYLRIFHHFDAFCFLPNVSRRLKHGDLSLQEFLRRNLETENSEIRHILGKEFLTCKRLRNHKFLIVLDGVDLVQDIEELNLFEKSNCLGKGSRIIITTRDEQVLQKSKVDAIYTPKLLTTDEAFQLLYSKAFPGEYPISHFEEMIYKVLEYANGLPLAIEILGSSFFGKSDIEWRALLNREEIIPPYEIIMVLRKSFDELDNMSKEMFLDLACFFTGKDVSYVEEILRVCGFRVERRIKLIEKSLMTISNQLVQMHGMLRAMGREIVRQEWPLHPENRSRLYLFNDLKDVTENNGKKAIRSIKAIVLDLEEPEGSVLKINALSQMGNLRLLIFRNVNFSGTLKKLSSKLRYVSWHQYPFTSLPSSFKSSETLVHLIMPHSNITEVWKGKMFFPKLRNMSLSGSKALIKTPDFEGVANLERLDLEGCIGLLQLDLSIAKLSKLKFLNLKNCINLVTIPNHLFAPNSLEVLNLAGCSKLAYCLKFSPLRSSIEVKLLSIWYNPLLETFLYFLLFVLPEL